MSIFGGGGSSTPKKKPTPAPPVPQPADRDVVASTMSTYKSIANRSYSTALLGGSASKTYKKSYASSLFSGGTSAAGM